jgi:hypothetical protein
MSMTSRRTDLAGLTLTTPRLTTELSGLSPHGLRRALTEGRVGTVKIKGSTFVILEDADQEAERLRHR